MDVQGTILNFALVSTKYLSLFNLSMRKMRPAFARKCMAVAVTCAGIAAELVKVWQHFSFPTRNKGKCTCGICCHRNCGICTCHCQGFGMKRNQSRKENDFWTGCCHSFSRSSSRQSEPGFYCAGLCRLRPWGCGHHERLTRHMRL